MLSRIKSSDLSSYLSLLKRHLTYHTRSDAVNLDRLLRRTTRGDILYRQLQSEWKFEYTGAQMYNRTLFLLCGIERSIEQCLTNQQVSYQDWEIIFCTKGYMELLMGPPEKNLQLDTSLKQTRGARNSIHWMLDTDGLEPSSALYNQADYTTVGPLEYFFQNPDIYQKGRDPAKWIRSSIAVDNRTIGQQWFNDQYLHLLHPNLEVLDYQWTERSKQDLIHSIQQGTAVLKQAILYDSCNPMLARKGDGEEEICRFMLEQGMSQFSHKNFISVSTGPNLAGVLSKDLHMNRVFSNIYVSKPKKFSSIGSSLPYETRTNQLPYEHVSDAITTLKWTPSPHWKTCNDRRSIFSPPNRCNAPTRIHLKNGETFDRRRFSRGYILAHNGIQRTVRPCQRKVTNSGRCVIHEGLWWHRLPRHLR